MVLCGDKCPLMGPLSRGEISFDFNQKAEINSPSWKGSLAKNSWEWSPAIHPPCGSYSGGSRIFCLSSSSWVFLPCPLSGNWQVLVLTWTYLLPSWELKTAASYCERRSWLAGVTDWGTVSFFSSWCSHCWRAEIKMVVVKTIVEKVDVQAAMVPPT